MIGRIREMLGLEAQCRATLIGLAALAANGSVKKIAGVKLNPGLGGERFENTTRRGVKKRGGQGGLAIRMSVQDPVVIVAFA